MAGFDITLDCADPERLAAFWAEALGYRRVGAAGAYVLLVPDEGSGPHLLLQRVPEPKAAKNRMHFDVKAADVEGTAERLEGLGARRIEGAVREEHGNRWIVMADPDGNEFCVCEEAR